MKNNYKLTLEYYKWLFDDDTTTLNQIFDSSIGEEQESSIPMAYYPEQYSKLINSEMFTRLKRITQTRFTILFFR